MDRCASAAALRGSKSLDWVGGSEPVAASGQDRSDAVLRASLQPDPSYTRCENLWSCSSAVSQRVWKSGGPTIAPLLCNVLCAANTFEHVCAHVNAHCSMSGKGPQEAVETSRHSVEAGHSTGGKRGASSPFRFDASSSSEAALQRNCTCQGPISTTGGGQ